MSLDRLAQQLWYGQRHVVLGLLLLPLSWLFAVLVGVRRWAYATGVFQSVPIDCPVIVVGNLTVGGTGKTPLVLWLANECARRGVRAAIICRGHRGHATDSPVSVTAHSDVYAVGDEAVLLAQSFPGPVIACKDRVAAARNAVQLGAHLVLSDDGLQHYRLRRDAEIVVVDAARGFGNGRVLPSGPLREPIARARRSQLLVCTQRGALAARVVLQDVPSIEVGAHVDRALSLCTGESKPLAAFKETRVHALAGIGNPDAFFDMLRGQGLELDTRTLPDHAPITPRDLEFVDRAPVLMTEKDAVKCRAFADDRLWRVPLQLTLRSEDQAVLWSVVQRALDAHPRHH